MTNSNKVPNRLIHEKSPYLLQHAHNPVDWFPWSAESFEKAAKEDKPIFLSIGYSTCHWCHVMEKESFEDEEVGNFMNEHFISIKVDREERPDVDSVYMTVCQSLTGSGGWPLTIIMTPDQKPFYAGTYFPKRSRYNMPGLIDILNAVVREWENNRENLISSSENIAGELEKYYGNEATDRSVSQSILEEGYNLLKDNFDSKYGGFGKVPKFPTPHKLMFLLRYYKMTGEKYALDMVETTLKSMYVGGLFDHIGFGFSRYSTDEKWLVPHFEKMLYDNALLIIAYLEAFQVTGKELYKSVAIKTLEYVLRELKSVEGGFYSAEDADSEGEEGKFYVFNPVEIIEILGEENGVYFNEYFHITPGGNFEGKNIPNLIDNKNFNIANPEIEKLCKILLNYRNHRTKLHKDDKVLTSWNGLMIAALGKAYSILGDEKYLQEGNKAVEFIFNNLVNEDGRLLARYRDGDASYPGYLEDYTYLCLGLIELYESTFNIDYLKRAIKLNNDMIRLFWDKENHGFFLYGEDGEKLIARPKELFDGALPSGNSVAAYNLLRLAKLTGDIDLEELANEQLKFISSRLYGGAVNYSFYLIAATFILAPSQKLIGVIKDTSDLEVVKDTLKEVNQFNLTTLIINNENKNEMKDLIPSIAEYDLEKGESTYYLCENNACLAPFNDINKLKKLLNK